MRGSMHRRLGWAGPGLTAFALTPTRCLPVLPSLQCSDVPNCAVGGMNANKCSGCDTCAAGFQLSVNKKSCTACSVAQCTGGYNTNTCNCKACAPVYQGAACTQCAATLPNCAIMAANTCDGCATCDTGFSLSGGACMAVAVSSSGCAAACIGGWGGLGRV